MRAFASVERGPLGVTLEGSLEMGIEKLIFPSLMRANIRIFASIASSVGELLVDLERVFVSLKGVLFHIIINAFDGIKKPTCQGAAHREVSPTPNHPQHSYTHSLFQYQYILLHKP